MNIAIINTPSCLSKLDVDFQNKNKYILVKTEWFYDLKRNWILFTTLFPEE